MAHTLFDVSTRGTGIAGVVAFVLLAAGGLVAPLWNFPDTTAPPAEVAAYVAEHRREWLASLFLYGLGMGMFVVFTAGLWAHLRRLEPEPHPLGAVFAFGAVGCAALTIAGFVPANALAYRAPDVAAAQSLYDLSFGFLALAGLPTAAYLGAYAVLVLRTRGLAPWTGWFAILAAAAHVAITATFLFESGFMSPEGDVAWVVPSLFFAWILFASVALLRAPTRA